MYHLSTFHFLKTEVNEWAGEERIQKSAKKCHEIYNVFTLTSRKKSLKYAVKVGVF